MTVACLWPIPSRCSCNKQFLVWKSVLHQQCNPEKHYSRQADISVLHPSDTEPNRCEQSILGPGLVSGISPGPGPACPSPEPLLPIPQRPPPPCPPSTPSDLYIGELGWCWSWSIPTMEARFSLHGLAHLHAPVHPLTRMVQPCFMYAASPEHSLDCFLFLL